MIFKWPYKIDFIAELVEFSLLRWVDVYNVGSDANLLIISQRLGFDLVSYAVAQAEFRICKLNERDDKLSCC